MAKVRSDLLQGTLDMIVLKTLELEPQHGWAISQRIRHISQGVFDLNDGSLYPALQRLERKGWITSSWQVTENNRRARYYRLTGAGRKRLAVEERKWVRASTAVNRILGIAYAGG
ncbi:MAG: PadR family transcriptional regulator [Gemmatimonadetes bacterium]|uniref:PadR family transcriptional regulator n=1 Tax=Candidatus Kutchimonas denitrificans TaxID=3056748 RepID=A0AAE4Z8Q2_9BACT|nr:PadR family transcriptional regulator [Gemmatimonadota bacterium]NIR73511.1 PadR family transcriptional regulator [Candidatus Kutchimonas denitrificans]NIR99470.1 PadR family transcriptional regulator [Gemmatimonadota bacterium]NIT65090.1 PadR family transcriptional regulator [Gemmatimonadota bacterium]NIV23623.1 PadR family transcriptional regulator [Gemmatimonadota bacterium]